MASYRGDTYDRYESEHSDHTPRDPRMSARRSAYPTHSYSDVDLRAPRHAPVQPHDYTEQPRDSLQYAPPPSRPTDPRVRPSARAPDPPGHDLDQPLIQRSIPEKSGYDSPLQRGRENFDPRQEDYRREQYDKHDQINSHYRHHVAEAYYDDRGHDRRSHEKTVDRREEPRAPPDDAGKGSNKLPWFEHELQQLSGSVWMEMNNLVKKSYFLALPEDAQRELWADNLRRFDVREPAQPQRRENTEAPMERDPRRDYYPDSAPTRPPPGGASPNRDGEIEAMRKERAILMAERRKIEELRKVEEARKRAEEEAAQLAVKEKKAMSQDADKDEKILARLSDAEKDSILSKWDWDNFKNHPTHFLYVKRDEIRQKKSKGKTDLEKWFAEIDEWEKKNENNFEDKLKGILYYFVLD